MPVAAATQDQNLEALYWLELATRILSGEISPDEALHALSSDICDHEAVEASVESA